MMSGLWVFFLSVAVARAFLMVHNCRRCKKTEGCTTNIMRRLVPGHTKGRRVVGQLLHEDYKIGQDCMEETEVTIPIVNDCQKYVENVVGLCRTN